MMLIDRVKWNNIPKDAVIMTFYALMVVKLRDSWKVVRDQIWSHKRTVFHPPRFVTGNRVLDVTIHMRLRHKTKISRHQGIHDTINRVVLTYLLTYSMVQSLSWAANWFAASQEIPRISRNPKVHYRTHKRPPPVSILGQPNPVHIPTSHLLEIHPNIIHPSTPRSPQWAPSLRFPNQDPIHPPLLIHTRHMPSPSHSYRFYHLHNIGRGVQII